MNIETSKVNKLHISNVEGIPPVTVILEDVENCSGRLTVTCGKDIWIIRLTWKHEPSIEKYVASDEFYSIYTPGRLHDLLGNSERFSVDTQSIRSDILRLRRAKRLNQRQARRLFNSCSSDFHFDWLSENRRLINHLYGGLNYKVPRVQSSQYIYERTVFKAVSDGLLAVYQDEEAA
ncbi:hypothetical protein [Algicola sagamiensis]|uniref:hypothetical protein n=1 Tax=Algicola sagamiensis TaxID=163869 RepID=UPI000376BDDF|nr:hypothetical protein [Algicola sagamiensis]